MMPNSIERAIAKTQKALAQKMEAPVIGPFRRDYRFLSNFSPLDVWVSDAFFSYPTVEHAYQAQKTFDTSMRLSFVQLPRPGDAKRHGRNIKIRSDWDEAKLGVMTDLVSQKFRRNPELATRLCETRDCYLAEINWWNDTFWGVSVWRPIEDSENQLGRILMRIRDYLDSQPSGVPI